MKIRVYYDMRDFFGAWRYGEEDVHDADGVEDTREALKRALDGLKKRSVGSYRVDAVRVEMQTHDAYDAQLLYDVMYLIEQEAGDAENGVFTVTRIEVYGHVSNSDAPVKMSRRAIEKTVMAAAKR